MRSSSEESSKNILVILLVLIVLFMGILLVLVAYSLRIKTNTNDTQKKISDITEQTYVIKKNQYPADTQIVDKESSDLLNVVVNKKFKLSSEYVPPNLVNVEGYPVRSDIAEHLKALISGAAKNGTPIKIISGYRSYDFQKKLYNNYVSIYGQQEADTFSARPGHSEHQTGLAVDVSNDQCMLKSCFGETMASKWIAANAQNYGFIIRYPIGKEKITGYVYEPWHLRYVGLFEAGFISSSEMTLDEMYDIPGGDYLP